MSFNPDLQFVLETGFNDARGETSVRSHAQRQAWRRRRAAAVERLRRSDRTLHRTATSSIFHCDNDQELVKDNALPQQAINNQTLIFEAGLASGNADPFDAAVVKIDSPLHAYLVFFANSMWSTYSKDCQPDQFLSTFGAMAVQDEGVLYAIAASAAVRQQSRRRMLQPQPSSDMTIYHEHELLYANLTSERIRKGLEYGDTSTSDLTIGLMAFLAMFEAVDFGRLDRCQMHLSAIQRIIEARGGIEEISWLWYERILAADIKTACVGLKRPLLPLLPTIDSSQQIRNIIGSETVINPSDSKFECMDILISPTCHEIIEQAQNLGLLIQNTSDHSFSDDQNGPETSLFLYQRLAIEQNLLIYMADFASYYSSMESCIHIGLLLFINTVFWINFESSCAVLMNLSLELKERLSYLRPSIRSISDNTQGPKIWLLFLGAYASRKTVHYPWFIERLKDITEQGSINTYSRLRDVLLGYIYSDLIYDKALQKISRDMFN